MKVKLNHKSGVFVFIFLFLGCNNNEIPQKKKVENIKAFAKLYGYVRWFHPSDEAQQVDWDRFACYGVKTVESAPNSEALKDSLLKLFLPIAPSLEIYGDLEKNDFDISKITPPDTKGSYPIYWQHSGVKLNQTPANVYKSIRVGRVNKLDYNKTIPLGKSITSSGFSKETLKLEALVKTENGSTGQLFFEGLNSNEYMNLSETLKPVYLKDRNWKKITIERTVRSDDQYIFFGINCMDTSGMFIDNIKLCVKSHNNGDSIVYANDFNTLDEDDLKDFIFDKNLPFDVQYITGPPGNNGYLSVRYKENNFRLFEKKPEFGKSLSEKIHPDLFIHLPLVLMADNQHSFPVANKEKINSLNSELNSWQSKIHKDLGSLVVVWNVIQHFFPYFDEVDVDWEMEFKRALNEYYEVEDFEKVLLKFTAKLKDGHVNVIDPTKKNLHRLPIKWEWIDENLVITNVYDKNSGLVPGTIVKKIANKKAKKYFAELEAYIPAPTIGFLKKASENLSLRGTPGDSVRLNVIKPDGTKDNVCLRYSLHPFEHYNKSLNKTRYQILKNNIYFLNLDQISMTEIDSLMPDLVKCKGIICDLRGYPNNNHEFWSHLMTQQDTAGHWLGIPQFIFPNQNRAGYYYPNIGTGMAPQVPHIDVPVVLITDAMAISYAESVALIVKNYNLATIIGQPTAGTNGSYNSLVLPNNTRFIYTGSKVVSFDNSKHYGVGVLPDVYVEKTISGVIEGSDEYLEKALEIIGEKIKY